MEALNHTLFLWINATEDSPQWLISLATFIAKDVIAIVPLLMGLAWRLFGGWAVPIVAVLAVCAGLAFARTLLRRHRTIERMLCEVPPAVPPGSGRERTQGWRQRFATLLPFHF